ncbi:protein OSCP1-like [Penaeus japonicus]|uniref:protein OSCP1-like n=1 Tax=Penaeus japonicus TaxID=27405 RepID=UPI001C70C85D|nr:protein OSCP1-like [Penaeus japonicus]
MTLRALPFQFLNLGGEMMYIIDHRLRAQNIPTDRANKVRNDILGIMLNRRFVDELFKPQELYTRCALREVFDRLAHASIMRLNTPSMDKLYDLMVMAMKHQVLLAPHPRDLLLLTLNHLDALRGFATAAPVLAQVESTQLLFAQTYGSMSMGELASVRHALLGFVQDLRIRVSLFLKESQQNPSGAFVIDTDGAVPYGTEVPGSIRIFDGKEEVTGIKRFVPGGHYGPSLPCGSLALVGDRVTALGTNMYSGRPEGIGAPGMERRAFDQGTASYPHQPLPVRTSTPPLPCGVDPNNVPLSGRARNELNLLAQLIGGSAAATDKEFKLNLFPTDDDRRNDNAALDDLDDLLLSRDVITIEAGHRGDRPELGKILGELTLHEGDADEDEGQDLLDLMDSC